jgi:hypothetical protein
MRFYQNDAESKFFPANGTVLFSCCRDPAEPDYDPYLAGFVTTYQSYILRF